MSKEEDKKPPKYCIGRVSSGEESRLERFIARIQQFFKKEPSYDLKLEGRIHELHHAMNRVLEDFHKFNKHARELLEDTLITNLEEIIHPIIKEIDRVRALLMHEDLPEVQVKIVHRCNSLLEKAKIWIELKGDNATSDYSLIIIEALVNHHIREFHQSVDRDIQLVLNYLNQACANVNISEEDRFTLRQLLKTEIEPQLVKLEELKQSTKSVDLKEIAAWKIRVNFTRSKLFATSLHLIDDAIEKS